MPDPTAHLAERQPHPRAHAGLRGLFGRRPLAESAASAPRQPAEGHGFFFLCGYMRSGTNWIERLLNLHPLINCRGEYHFEMLRVGVDRFLQFPWHMAHSDPMRTEVEAGFQDLIRRCMLQSARLKPDARLLGDRTPRALQVLLPGTPHIWIMRDPRDVVVSYAFHLLRIGGPVRSDAPRPEVKAFNETMTEHLAAFEADKHYFDRNPELLFGEDGSWAQTLTVGWVERTRADLRVADQIEAGEIDASLLRIRYEQVYGNTERERQRMYRFLGVDDRDADVISEGTRTTAGFKEEDAHAFNRKGKVGDWHKYFTDRAKQRFKETAGDLLQLTGYAEDDNW